MSTVVTVVSSKCRGVASLPGRTPCRKVGSGCPASFRLLLSCWVPGRALLESLGEQGRGVCSFRCRRTCPPLWGAGRCRALSWGPLLPAKQGLCVGGKKGSRVPWASFHIHSWIWAPFPAGRSPSLRGMLAQSSSLPWVAR